MCELFYDVRCFGAVLSTGPNAGQVRGPVQLTFARSIDPIVALDHTIVRGAVTTRAEEKDQGGANRTMGRKSTISYALYRAYGFFSPALARQTGFSSADLELLWEAIGGMFEQDRSASRGLMSLRKLIVFRHASALGNAPAHALFDMVSIRRREERPAREFSDYLIDTAAPPRGVEML
jgi:CRISPR-associated protein Csd2